jgi:hypothetical protein
VRGIIATLVKKQLVKAISRHRYCLTQRGLFLGQGLVFLRHASEAGAVLYVNYQHEVNLRVGDGDAAVCYYGKHLHQIVPLLVECKLIQPPTTGEQFVGPRCTVLTAGLDLVSGLPLPELADTADRIYISVTESASRPDSS